MKEIVVRFVLLAILIVKNLHCLLICRRDHGRLHGQNGESFSGVSIVFRKQFKRYKPTAHGSDQLVDLPNILLVTERQAAAPSTELLPRFLNSVCITSTDTDGTSHRMSP